MTQKTKMYYAISDSHTGEAPIHWTNGLGSTKEVICFYTPEDRQHWLNETKLLTARAIDRDAALKHISSWDQIDQDVVKRCRIYNTHKFHTIIKKYPK